LPRPTLLIADDHPDVRERIRDLVQDVSEVVAVAANGIEALEACGRFHPDVVLLDIAMPGMNGLEAAREMKKRGCHARIIFVSAGGDEELARTALALGGSAFVPKARMATDLLPAIERALALH
jgi:DNA-binding NarL/FixJ family response regulator